MNISIIIPIPRGPYISAQCGTYVVLLMSKLLTTAVQVHVILILIIVYRVLLDMNDTRDQSMSQYLPDTHPVKRAID